MLGSMSLASTEATWQYQDTTEWRFPSAGKCENIHETWSPVELENNSMVLQEPDQEFHIKPGDAVAFRFTNSQAAKDIPDQLGIRLEHAGRWCNQTNDYVATPLYSAHIQLPSTVIYYSGLASLAMSWDIGHNMSKTLDSGFQVTVDLSKVLYDGFRYLVKRVVSPYGLDDRVVVRALGNLLPNPGKIVFSIQLQGFYEKGQAKSITTTHFLNCHVDYLSAGLRYLLPRDLFAHASDSEFEVFKQSSDSACFCSPTSPSVAGT